MNTKKPKSIPRDLILIGHQRNRGVCIAFAAAYSRKTHEENHPMQNPNIHRPLPIPPRQKHRFPIINQTSSHKNRSRSALQQYIGPVYPLLLKGNFPQPRTINTSRLPTSVNPATTPSKRQEYPAPHLATSLSMRLP